jgi:predicted nucleic acid-binding protein
MQINEITLVLDTSFISALFKANDSMHADAIAIYNLKIIGNTIIIPISVILELSVLAKNNFDFELLKKFLEQFKYKTYYLDAFFEQAMNSYNKRKKNKPLKAMDLSVLVSALDSEAELITFDKKLAQAFAFSNKVSIN